MPTGVCRLCLHTADLQDSHLLPKAFYKLARAAGDRNPNPIVVNPKVALKTSSQVSDYLLCRDCEARLNRGGEKWIIENCWRSEADFPLNAALKTSTPMLGSKPELMIYPGVSIAAIDIEKIVYFPVSVFWRAAVHDWGGNPVKLELGPYEEDLRQFLLGVQGFPANAVLVVTVSSSTETERNEFINFPWLNYRETTFRAYKFIIPGVTFQLFTGRGLSSGMRTLCTTTSPDRLIFMSNRLDERNLSDMAKLIASAKTVGDLR